MKRFIIGVMIGAVILGAFFIKADMRELLKVLLGVSIDFILIGVGIRVFVMWVKSVRWALVIHSATGKPVRRAFAATAIGFAGNVLLPVRLGEIARACVIDKHNQIGRTLALSTIGISYLLDLVFLVPIFLLMNFWFFHLYSVSLLPFFFAMVILLILISLLVTQNSQRPWHSILTTVQRVLEKTLGQRITGHFKLIIKGFAILGHAGAIRWVLLLTLTLWGLETIAVYFMLLAFEINATFLIAATWLVLINLSFVFPVSPGNVGIVQALSVILLGTYGITQETALAYSIGFQSISCLVFVILGATFFCHEKMDIGLIRRLAREDNTNVLADSLEK